MSIAAIDRRLLKALRTSRDSSAQLVLEDLPARLRDEALALLDGASEPYAEAIAAEDQSDVAEVTTRSAVGVTRARLNRGYGMLLGGLQTGLLLTDAQAQPPAAAPETVQAMLDDMPTSGFAALSDEDALAHMQRALTYAEALLPAELRPALEPHLRPALDAHAAALSSEGEASTAAITAQSRLEAHRQAAHAAYLDARTLMRVALRRAGLEGKLNQIMPSLTSVLEPSSPRASSDEADPAPPALGADLEASVSSDAPSAQATGVTDPA